MVLHETCYIVVKKDDKLLLIKRGNQPGKGLWAFPGGHIDPGETINQGAQREANEEVGGVKIEDQPFYVFVHDVPTGEKRYSDRHQHRCHTFWGKVAGEVVAGDDAAEARWFTPEEAKRLKIVSPTIMVFKKILGDYLDTGK